MSSILYFTLSVASMDEGIGSRLNLLAEQAAFTGCAAEYNDK
jgi:hypothetical protein